MYILGNWVDGANLAREIGFSDELESDRLPAVREPFIMSKSHETCGDSDNFDRSTHVQLASRVKPIAALHVRADKQSFVPEATGWQRCH